MRFWIARSGAANEDDVPVNEGARASIESCTAQSLLGVAVASILYPCVVLAQPASVSLFEPAELQEITVTATRRLETLESVPYSISVVSADQLAQAGVTDLASLANQVPGLSTYNLGARFVGATAPIIRGINATSEPRGFRTFEQDPVGTISATRPYPATTNSKTSIESRCCGDPREPSTGPAHLGVPYGSYRILP